MQMMNKKRTVGKIYNKLPECFKNESNVTEFIS